MAELGAGEQRLLRAALLLESMLGGVLGLLCIVAADAAAGLLGLEQVNATLWLRLFGFLLIVYGAVLLWVSAQQHISRRVSQAVLLLNIACVVAVAAMLTADNFGLSVTGMMLAGAVMIAVTLLALLQYVGMQRAPV